MSPAVFRRAGPPDLHVLQADDTPAAGWWAGCWFSIAQDVDEMSPDDVFRRGGTFVFCDHPELDDAVRAARVASLHRRLDRHHDLRVLWLRGIDGPDATVAGALRVRAVGAGWQLSTLCQIGAGGYTLVFPGGLDFSAADDGLRLTGSATDTPALATRSGLGRLPLATAGVTIPFGGAAAGSIEFGLDLRPSDGTGPADLELLDVGLRYHIDAASDPDTEFAVGGALSWQQFPVFDPRFGAVTLDGRFDPLAPFDGSRTHLEFLRRGQETTNQVLRSWFVDRLGRPVHLQPVVAASQPRPRLVLRTLPTVAVSVTAAAPHVGPADPAGLVPEGAFELVGHDGEPPPKRVLFGLSGNEYVGFEEPTGNRLVFVPDQPALAPNFRMGPGSTGTTDGSSGNGAATGLLTGAATTAQVYVEATRAVYYAQPDDSLLWKAGELRTPSGTTDRFLEHMELDGGRLPDAIDEFGRPRALPWVPFGGVPAHRAALCSELEHQVLAPQRRRQVFELTQDQLLAPAEQGAPMATPDQVAVTSQGLLATFVPDSGVWSELVLAMPRSGRHPLTLAGSADQPEQGIRGPMLAAMQTSNLFCVVDSVDGFGQWATLVNAIVGIEGWNFNVDPSVWHRHGTIMIFKFNRKSLTELLGSTDGWSHADVFTDDAEATRRRLVELVDEARSAVGGGSDDAADAFADFVRIVDTAEWQGVLFLDVDLPLSGLPDEIAALAVGIDASRFKAHHLGVTLSPIEYDGEAVIAMDPSAFFGLIWYRDREPLLPSSDPYQFKVDALIVRFANSIVVDFSSSVLLRERELFGEPVAASNADQPLAEPVVDDVVVLNGVLARHDGRASYSFTTGEPHVFPISSGVIDEVEVTRIAMRTSSAPGVGGGVLEAYFEHAGTARFAVQEGLDAFGYGREPDDPGGSDGLVFSRLLVRFSAQLPPAGDPAATVTPTWRFDISEMIIDQAASRRRRSSLPSRFPLKFTGFVQGGDGTSPTDGGFLPVNSPMPAAALTAPWFGFTYALDLGSAGGLVSGKDFSSGLIVAWSPSDRGASATFLGLRLPGSDGASKSLKVQGIFDITIASIDLYVSPEANGVAYTLLLRNIAFEVLRMKIPPSGGVDIALFADPNTTGKPGPLGWYAATTSKAS